MFIERGITYPKSGTGRLDKFKFGAQPALRFEFEFSRIQSTLAKYLKITKPYLSKFDNNIRELCVLTGTLLSFNFYRGFV
jgi:hypothetical protein